MDKPLSALIVPANYPELKLLVWNRHPACPIEAEEAFELYEHNWRHVDAERLTSKEAELIEMLTTGYGQGYMFTR